MTICWNLWKRPSNLVLVIKKIVKDIEDCKMEPQFKGALTRDTVCIGWKRPQEGWIKLNFDDACKDKGAIARCSSLLRDGNWIKGYVKKIDSCDALTAKM